MKSKLSELTLMQLEYLKEMFSETLEQVVDVNSCENDEDDNQCYYCAFRRVCSPLCIEIDKIEREILNKYD